MLRFSPMQETLFTERQCLGGVSLDLVDKAGALVTTHAPLSVCFAVHRTDNWNALPDVLGQNGIKDERFRSVTIIMVGGRISLDWMKFFKVSSKNGGHFVLKAVAVNFDLLAWSSAFVVKSCRVMNDQSKKVSATTASTPVEKIEGIGREYAGRFKQHRIFTALHLAQCYEDTDGKMVNIRNARGKLTMIKLQSLGRDMFLHLKAIGNFTSSSGVPRTHVMSASPPSTSSPNCPMVPPTTPQLQLQLNQTNSRVDVAVNHYFGEDELLALAKPFTVTLDDQSNQQVVQQMPLVFPLTPTIIPDLDQPAADFVFAPTTTVMDNWQAQIQQELEAKINEFTLMELKPEQFGVVAHQIDGGLHRQQNEDCQWIFENLLDLDF